MIDHSEMTDIYDDEGYDACTREIIQFWADYEVSAKSLCLFAVSALFTMYRSSNSSSMSRTHRFSTMYITFYHFFIPLLISGLGTTTLETASGKWTWSSTGTRSRFAWQFSLGHGA
jgi:hypothetical protein